jgi:hypothetical protein
MGGMAQSKAAASDKPLLVAWNRGVSGAARHGRLTLEPDG